MKIDGRALANNVLATLAQKVANLQELHIRPHLIVILIGDDPASLSFIKQKSLAAESIGVKLTLHHLPQSVEYEKVANLILACNDDPTIHGIIIQRPIPKELTADKLTNLINPFKDVDGFLDHSPFVPPLGLAIGKILSDIYYAHVLHSDTAAGNFSPPLTKWLRTQNVVLIGRGETGGKPIAKCLTKYGVPFMILHRGIEDPEEFLKNADIVISAVGQSGILKPEFIKQGSIVLGVGMHKENNLLTGDFDETTIASKATYYTPTPGGVGPVNVAYLMYNVVTASLPETK